MDDLEHARYADWDAAYVLGSLSRTERSEYEQHLDACDRCQSAIGKLAPLPGLLARVDPEEALAILEENGQPLPLPQADRRPRHVRLIAVALAAAAVILVAILVPTLTGGHPTPSPTATVALQQTVPSPLTATVSLTKATWGTRVDMTCTYAATYGGPEQSYRLYLIDRQGHASLVSSWRAGPGDVARTAGSSDLSPAQVASVQVRSATGKVLLAGTVSG